MSLKSLMPPRRNPEIKVNFATSGVSRDSSLASIQTQLDISLVSLGQAINTIITSGEARSATLLGDPNDASRLLLNLFISVSK